MNSFSKNPKYSDIYTTAKQLFQKFGLKRVTIEEICSEAKVSKMTFYKFFPNKSILAKTILKDLVASAMLKFDEIVNSNLEYSKKIEAIFLLKIEAMNELSQDFMNDIYSYPETGLKEYLEELSKQSSKQITNFYIDSQKKGFIRKDVNIAFIMAYSTSMPKLMEDKYLMSQYKKPMDFILEVMNLLFYGIISRNE